MTLPREPLQGVDPEFDVGAAGGALPGPRRRNSEIMSCPVETDSSSFEIVPVPVACEMVAFVGLLSPTVKVSSTSGVVSPLTVTMTCFVVSFEAKVSVPLAD